MAKHQFVNKATGRIGSVMVITFDAEDDNRIQNYSYEYVEDLMEEWAAYEPYEPEIKDEDIKDAKVTDLRPQWKEIAIQTDALNRLIHEAILHGGDGGGAYLTNREGLEKAIDNYLEVTGIKPLVDVYWKDEDDPLLIVNDGCCHCPGCMRNYLNATKEEE